MSPTRVIRSKRNRIARLLSVVALATVTGLLATAASATPGDLDPSFGDGGLVTTAVPDHDAVVEAVALQSDGKIVAAGWLRKNDGAFPPTMSFLIARYSEDGTLDTAFGSGGLATAVVGSSSAAEAVAVQADGKIVAGGFTWDFPRTFALTRFNTDGNLDSTFGNGGKVITAVGFNTEIHDIAIQGDGKIVVGGGNGDAGDARNFIVARYEADGRLDSAFGSGGVSYTNFHGRGGMAWGLAIQPDGKIVEVGDAGLESYPFNALGVVRFTSDGTLDPTFGAGGKVTTSFEGGGSGRDIVVQPDGKLVAAGAARTSSGNAGFGLARFNTDGSVDSSFGSNGTVLTDFGPAADGIRSVALRPDGKIIVAGDAVTPSFSGEFALAQYNADGSLDTSFGVGGRVTTDFAGASEAANGVAVQADGKVVAGGVVSPSSGLAVLGLARYLGDSALAPQVAGHGVFGTGGDGRVSFRLSNEQVTFDRGTRFRFGGDVQSVTGEGKGAALTGTGSWNGKNGYSFEVSVVDNAPWGRLKDTIDVVVRDPAGAVVLSSFGPQLLKQGDISVTAADSS
jgi:uncharacterized delta-60 repeat protein